MADYMAKIKAGEMPDWKVVNYPPSSAIAPSAELQGFLASNSAMSRNPKAPPASAMFGETSLPITRKIYATALQTMTGGEIEVNLFLGVPPTFSST